MYAIHVDATANLVTIRFSGLLTPEEAASYIAEVRHAIATKGLRAGYRLVIDISDCPIQRQDTILAMGTHIAAMPKASRIAIVSGSSLARMQIRRLFTQPYARIVANMGEGRAWAVSGHDSEYSTPT